MLFKKVAASFESSKAYGQYSNSFRGALVNFSSNSEDIVPFERVGKALIYYAAGFAMDCFLSGYSPPSLIYNSSVFEKSNANNGLCSVVVATSRHQLRFIRQIRHCSFLEVTYCGLMKRPTQ